MKNIFLLALGMFALGLDAYVVAGLLPEIGVTFHATPSEVGQTVTVFTLCYALAAPVFATLLAGKPIRKILALALAVFSCANAASALAGSLEWLLAARAVAGLGAGLFSPIAVAAAVALVSKEQKGRALGLTLGGMSTGTVIGVPAGLWVASRIGWQGTLWLVTALGLIGLIGILLRLPDIPAVPPPSLRQRAGMLANPLVAATVGVSFLTAVASLGLYTYVAPILQGIANIDTATSYFWAWGMGGMAGSFLIGAAIDWTQRPLHLMLGLLTLLTLALALLPTALHSPLLGYLPFLVWGATGWASQAPQQHTLLDLQPEHGAAAVALNSSANYLGGAVGAALGGVIIATGGLSRLPLLAACVAFLALIIHTAILARFGASKMKKNRTAA